MKVGPEPGENLPIRSQQSIPALRNGKTLRVYVEGLRGSRATVRAGAIRFTARLEGDVAPGRWYRVRVVGTGRAVVLRTLPEGPLSAQTPSPVAAYGLQERDAQAVVRAFVRSGLPLLPERLELARRRVRSSGRLSLAERSRLAAVLEAKGLLDSDSLWDRALDAASGRGGSGSGTGHGRGDGNAAGHGSGRDDGAGQGGGSGEDAADAGSDAADADADAADHVGGAATDPDATLVAASDVRAALAGAREADDALQLINHRRDRSGDWIVVPLEFQEHDEFRAALKIRFGDDPGGPGRRYREAVLDVFDGEERWTFAVLPAGDRVRVVALSTPSSADAPERLKASFEPLVERLERYGVGFATAPMSKDSNDGFSTSDDAGILQSVDSRA